MSIALVFESRGNAKGVVRKLCVSVWWWVSNALHGSMGVLLQTGGFQGRAVSEAVGIWTSGNALRVWPGGPCKDAEPG